MSKRLLTAGLLLGAPSLLLCCSAEPESPAFGSCPINCSKPHVSGAEFQLLSNWDEAQDEVTLSCEADFACTAANKAPDCAPSTVKPSNVPLSISFRVVEPQTPFGTDITQGSDEANSEGNAPDAFTPPRPIAGVGFEPVLRSFMLSSEKTNEEFRNTTTKEVVPAKYTGVVTPSAEWCSDTCGNIKYEFWPLCKQGDSHTVQAGIAVHGAALQKMLKITISNGGT